MSLDELKKHGMKETERMHDPATNRHLDNIFTGERFFMKLYHTAETKESGRHTGQYTSDDQPAKGGEDEQQAKASWSTGYQCSYFQWCY
jgi:DNA-directed RNA polymerase beta subunit